jgi:hypothetical protein
MGAYIGVYLEIPYIKYGVVNYALNFYFILYIINKTIKYEYHSLLWWKGQFSIFHNLKYKRL